ncbi:signal peptidase II [Schaalia odontolytica]|uniref:Lipoprotein signal peptidase n=1 Tax=Schaalia odontolytica TaxID=1660 RepID=A0A2X0VPX5_9ACTO|nr:signal peptidase II [Schaalia odontolytica]WMS27188.1 signal peptidase II [Schaalia odontolytica]SPT55982.1 Lipoprotein signal peptidase [Schaalia odontolytica]
MADSSHPIRTHSTWFYAGLVFAAAVITDQASKIWARGALDSQEPRPLIGEWLSLRLVHNSGAAFSFAAGKTWVLTIFTVIIIGVLAVLARRVHRASTLLAIALLTGGAVGNLIDRLIAEPGFGVGHVTDFIAYGTWFVGNVADIWIVLGAPLLALALSREPSKEDA